MAVKIAKRAKSLVKKPSTSTLKELALDIECLEQPLRRVNYVISLERGLVLEILLIVALFNVAFITHMPVSVQNFLLKRVFISEPIRVEVLHSDYSLVLVDPCRGGSVDAWFNESLLERYCRSEYNLPIPYRDYEFKHFSLNGFLWHATIVLTYALTPRSVEHMPVYASEHARAAFYVVYSALILAFVAACYAFLSKLYRALELNSKVLRVASILTASAAVYSVYSWEVVHLALLVAALYYLAKESYGRFYLLTGLLASANPIGFALIFLVVHGGMHKKLFVLDKRAALLLAGLAPVFVQAALSPTSVIRALTWFLEERCSSCVYLLLINDPNSQVLRGLALCALTIAITVYLTLEPARDDSLHKCAYVVLFLAIIVSLNLVFEPQTLLLLHPALPVLYGFRSKLKSIALHYSIDSLNASIAVLWSKDRELRSALSFLGIPPASDPLSMDSPVQWIAQIRNLALVLFVASLAASYLKLREADV